MYIEFMGLPGAGKTTLRRDLLSSLRQNGEVQFISSEDAFLEASKADMDWVLRYLLRYLPRAAGLRLAEKLRNRSLMQFEAQNRFLAEHGAALDAFLTSSTYLGMSNLDKQRVIGNFLGMGSMWQCLNTTAMQHKVIFFEEGLVQKSIMFIDRAQRGTIDQDKVLRYLNHIPRSNLVIYVSASTQTSWDRMLGRPDGLTDRLKSADEGAIRRFLESSKAHLDFVADSLRKNRQQDVIEFDSESHTSSEFDAVMEKIRQLSP